MAVAELTDTNFDSEVLESDLPVLVDFWAPWCGPCRQIAPVVDELAGEYQGHVKVMKLNVDDAQSTAQTYGVSSIPTLILFRGGEVVEKMVGLQPKAKLQQVLDGAQA